MLMASKRAILEQLTRDELWKVVDEHGLEVADRRKVDLLVDAAAKAKRVESRQVLERLSRDRLREVCQALGVDDSGNGKAPLVARLLGENADSGEGFSLTTPSGKAAGAKKVTKRAPAPTAGVPDGTAPADVNIYSVEVMGIDLYDPHTGQTSHDTGENVAAWFVDHDYDGKTFCICQALFPAKGMKNPWEKLQKALKGSIDEDKFEQLRSTRSLPFKPGKRVAVKVIDARGNEVIQLLETGKAHRRGKS